MDGIGHTYELASILLRRLRDVAVDPVVLAEEELVELAHLCRALRVEPLLASALSDGTITAERANVLDLAELRGRVMAEQLRVEAELVAVSKTLSECGIDHRVLKGLATAHLDYAQPSLRQVGDVDVLVDSLDMERALGALGDEGASVAYPPRRGRWELEHAVTLVSRGIEIDVHHRLLRRAPGVIAGRLDLFDDPQCYEVGGRELRALPVWLRLVHAAGHLVCSPPDIRRWSTHADLVLLADDPDVLQEASDKAASVGLGGILEFGIGQALADAHLGPSVYIPRPSSAVDWAYVRHRRSAIREHLAEIRHQSVAEAVRSHIAWLIPGEDYTTAHDPGGPHQVVRLLRTLRGRSRSDARRGQRHR